MVSRRVLRLCGTAALACAAIAAPRLAAADAPASASAQAATSAPMPAKAASAADRYEDDWTTRVRPWKRLPAVAVTVEAAGLGDDARDPTSEAEPCASFRPSERQVRAYVARARRVSQRGFFHETDWSVCYATGRLRFRDGVEAQWMVQRLGAGYVSIAGARHYLDCPDCALGGRAAEGKR